MPVVAGFLIQRKRWDSNPRAREDYLISSQARYDHFDTFPNPECLLQRTRPFVMNTYSVYDMIGISSTVFHIEFTIDFPTSPLSIHHPLGLFS